MLTVKRETEAGTCRAERQRREFLTDTLVEWRESGD